MCCIYLSTCPLVLYFPYSIQTTKAPMDVRQAREWGLSKSGPLKLWQWYKHKLLVFCCICQMAVKSEIWNCACRYVCVCVCVQKLCVCAETAHIARLCYSYIKMVHISKCINITHAVLFWHMYHIASYVCAKIAQCHFVMLLRFCWFVVCQWNKDYGSMMG